MNQFFNQRIYAISTGSTFIPHAITKDDGYRERTHWVSFEQVNGTITARVYRESSDANPLLSCDVRTWDPVTGQWSRPRKDKKKYPRAMPDLPKAQRYTVDGFEVLAVDPLTADEQAILKKLVFILKAPQGPLTS